MVRKRGGRWYYDIHIRGERYRGAIPEARNKREAEQAETRIRSSIFDGTYGRREPGTHLVLEFIEDVYLPWAEANKRSWRNVVDRGRVLGEYFKGKSFRDVSPMLVEKFKRDRLATTTKRGGTRSPNTINKELQLLSRVFNMAIDNGLADVNPCARVRKFKVEWQRDRYLSPEEEAQLTGRYAHLRPIVTIALHTGMQRGEILGLEWSRVDFHREVIWVKRTKSGKPRYLPMNAVVRELLWEIRATEPDATFVFGGLTGQAMTDIKNIWKSVTKKAGIEDFRFHDLRHTAATRMAEAGVDIRTIAEFLGHATIQMTMRYAHATDDAKRRAADALAAYASTCAHTLAGTDSVTKPSQRTNGGRRGRR